MNGASAEGDELEFNEVWYFISIPPLPMFLRMFFT